MCLIFIRKGQEGGFIPENIEFQKSQLTLYLLFFKLFFFRFVLLFFLFVGWQSFFSSSSFLISSHWVVFWKIGAHVFLKRTNITLDLGEVFEECLWRVLLLVELQVYSLLLDWEMSPLGGIFRDYTWILGALFHFFQKSS